MRPKNWKGPSHLGQQMHAHGVNVSSEMIKGIGIRILDGVNEMLLACYCVYCVMKKNAYD